MNMGYILSKLQYDEIMNEIVAHHRFGAIYTENKTSRFIKYIRPNWDMRDGKCFCIDFDNKRFDFRQSSDPMYDRIMKWLNGNENVDYEII